MKKIHIPATPPKSINVATKLFNVPLPYGRSAACRLSLSPHGDYSLEVIGPVSETQARRTDEYGKAFRKVTADMVNAYDEANRGFTFMHLKMPKVETRSSYEQQLASLAPKKYTRQTFAMPMPTKADVEDDLRQEMLTLNPASTSAQQAAYVKQHINALVENRQQAWIEARDLFDKMENVREEQENAKLRAEYKTLYEKKKAALNGDAQDVFDAMIALPTQAQIPFVVNLEFEYNKEKGLLTANAIVEDGLGVPQRKATVLPSGKLSIKDKLVREVNDDVTHCTLSLTYLLAATLFNVSCNIKTLRLSLFNWRQANPLLFVEFDRDSFSKINPKQVDLYSDILARPSVIYFKRKNDALVLSTWDVKQFDQKVQSLCSDGAPSSRAKSCEELNAAISQLAAIVHSFPKQEYAAPESPDDAQPQVNFDPLIREVAMKVVESQIASASYIQRTFEIGYERAKRLLSQLEQMGVVSEPDHRLNRTVLINNESDLKETLKRFVTI